MDTPPTSTDGIFSRRAVLIAAAGSALLAMHAPASAKAIFAEVWKDPNCGCCKDWVVHLEAASFKVKVNDTGNEGIRERLRVDRKYGSCHTALIGGYAIEGHVPAREIRRLLKEQPAALGLAVPECQWGRRGWMEGSMGTAGIPTA